MMKITLFYVFVVLSSINFSAAENECFLLVSIEPCGRIHELSFFFRAKRTVTRHLQASDQKQRICLPVGCDGDHRMKGQAVLVHDNKTTTEFSENYDLLYVDVDSCEAGTYVNAEIPCDPSLSQKHKVYDKVLDVDCPDRQAFYRVRSEHDNGAEDRIWQWDCTEVTEISRSCYTTEEYVNDLDSLMLFQCNADHVMAGVYSYHYNLDQDRQWKFTCCRAEGYYTKNCQLSDYLNDWDAAIDYSVSSRVFVGAFSEHSNSYEDRRWKIMSCEYVSDLLQVSTTQETYVVGEGNTLTAKCTSVGGRAPSEIRFFSPSGLLLHGTGRVVLTSLIQESTTSSSVTYSRTLKLSDALVGDSGTYTCEATNNEKSVFYFHVEAILSITATLEAIIQQPVHMTCLATVAVLTSSVMTWWREEPDGNMIQIISETGIEISQEQYGKYLLRSVLKIKEVNLSHTGPYSCKVSTTSNNFQADVTLAVLKDVFEVSTTQESYVVGEGATVVLKCTTFAGQAPSDISFFSPSGLLLNGTGSNQRFMLSSLSQESASSSSVTYSRTLTLSDALVEDSGAYACEATNDKNVKNKTFFDVHVEAILSVTDALEAIIHQPAHMTCLATVAVLASSDVTWWREEPDGNVIQIISETRFEISLEEFGQHLLRSILKIEEVDSLHTGTYSCKVSTTSNNFQADVTLALMKEVPDTTVKITISSFDSRWVVLDLTAVFNENKPIEFFSIYYNDFSVQLNIGEEGLLHGSLLSLSYNISSNVSPYTNYVFNVSSCNDLGCSKTENSDSVSVTTLQSSASPPRQLNVMNTETTSLWLTWMEPQIPNGKISFYQIKYVGTKLYNNISEALLSSLSLEGDRDTTGPTFYFNLTELVPGTQYTVTVTAFNEAGEGMPSSSVVESTLVDAPPSGEEGFIIPNFQHLVIINDQQLKIFLPRPLNINGALSHHQVVVVLLPEDFSPASLLPADALFPNIDTFMTYADSKTYKGPNPVAYITAEFDDKLFPSDSVFTVGVDGQPNDRQYENGPLPHGTTFAFFLRTYPLINISEIDKKHEKERQYSLFSSSDFVYGNALESYESESKTVIIIGGSAGAAGFAVTLIVVFIIALVAVTRFRKKKVTIESRDIVIMNELESKENADLDVSKDQVESPVYYSCGSGNVVDDNIYENP